MHRRACYSSLTIQYKQYSKNNKVCIFLHFNKYVKCRNNIIITNFTSECDGRSNSLQSLHITSMARLIMHPLVIIPSGSQVASRARLLLRDQILFGGATSGAEGRGARGRARRTCAVWEVGYASAGERTLSGSTAVVAPLRQLRHLQRLCSPL